MLQPHASSFSRQKEAPASRSVARPKKPLLPVGQTAKLQSHLSPSGSAAGEQTYRSATGTRLQGGMSAASRQWLEPDPGWGYKAWSCCGLCCGEAAEPLLPMLKAAWSTLLKSRGAGTGGAACCLPCWSGLCSAKAAPRGPYIHGKGVGGESKLPREEPSLLSVWEVPDQRCSLFPPC